MIRVASDLLSEYRVESFTAVVCDRNDRPLDTLDNITGGTITASVDARIKTAGTLSVVTDKPISWWANCRIKIFANVNGKAWSLGVFLPSSPCMKHTAAGVEFTVELSDKLIILDKDCISDALSLPVGTVLTRWVTNCITASGETNINIEPSTRTNKRPLVWEPGTPKLTVINDILDYIGYFSLLADENGQYTASPYIIPAERPIMWRFGAGEYSLTSTNFTYEQNLDDIPNKIIYIAQSASTVVNGVTVEGTYKQQPLKAVATNTDPASPFSYQNRGRWVTRVNVDAEAESLQELQKMVDKALANAQDPFTRIECRTALLPVRLNHLARFTTPDYDLVGAVRKTEVTLQPGSFMNVTLRKAKYANL